MSSAQLLLKKYKTTRSKRIKQGNIFTQMMQPELPFPTLLYFIPKVRIVVNLQKTKYLLTRIGQFIIIYRRKGSF